MIASDRAAGYYCRTEAAMDINRFKAIYEAIEPDERGCKIWPMSLTAQGYPQLNLSGKIVTGHRLALQLKLGRPIAPGLRARHTCDVHACLAQEHLLEGTQQQNVQDSIERGRFITGERNGWTTKPEQMPRGSTNGRSKLTENQVLAIVELCNSGVSQKEAGARFGVKQGAVTDIMRGINWGHLTGIGRSE